MVIVKHCIIIPKKRLISGIYHSHVYRNVLISSSTIKCRTVEKATLLKRKASNSKLYEVFNLRRVLHSFYSCLNNPHKRIRLQISLLRILFFVIVMKSGRCGISHCCKTFTVLSRTFSISCLPYRSKITLKSFTP